MLEKTLESPLDYKEIQPVHSKGDQPWVFFGRNDAKAETPVLWPLHAKSWLIGKDSDAGRDWGQEKGTTEWDGWMASPTQWTWVWVNSGSWWWTGRPGVLQFHGVTKSLTRLSDWTELNWKSSWRPGKTSQLESNQGRDVKDIDEEVKSDPLKWNKAQPYPLDWAGRSINLTLATPRLWQGQKPECMELRRWEKCRGIKKLSYELKEVEDNKQGIQAEEEFSFKMKVNLLCSYTWHFECLLWACSSKCEKLSKWGLWAVMGHSAQHTSLPRSCGEKNVLYLLWERRERISDLDANSLGGHQSRIAGSSADLPSPHLPPLPACHSNKQCACSRGKKSFAFMECIFLWE